MLDNCTETWRYIKGYENLYIISTDGEVRSVDRTVRDWDKRWNKERIRLFKGKTLKQLINDRGYPYVTLSKQGIETGYQVHTLVLETFIGHKPIGMEACHNDGNRRNPKLANLRWDTRSNNHKDKLKHDTHLIGERSPLAKLNQKQVDTIRTMWNTCNYSQQQLADLFLVGQTTISQIVRGIRYRCINKGS